MNDAQKIVLRAYEVLWTSLVAKVYREHDDEFRIEYHDRFEQKENFFTQHASTIESCKRLIEKRHGQVIYKSPPTQSETANPLPASAPEISSPDTPA